MADLIWGKSTRAELTELLQSVLSKEERQSVEDERLYSFTYSAHQKELRIDDVFISLYNSDLYFRPKDIHKFAGKLIEMLENARNKDTFLDLLKALRNLVCFQNVLALPNFFNEKTIKLLTSFISFVPVSLPLLSWQEQEKQAPKSKSEAAVPPKPEEKPAPNEPKEDKEEKSPAGASSPDEAAAPPEIEQEQEAAAAPADEQKEETKEERVTTAREVEEEEKKPAEELAKEAENKNNREDEDKGHEDFDRTALIRNSSSLVFEIFIHITTHFKNTEFLVSCKDFNHMLFRVFNADERQAPESGQPNERVYNTEKVPPPSSSSRVGAHHDPKHHEVRDDREARVPVALWARDPDREALLLGAFRDR